MWADMDLSLVYKAKGVQNVSKYINKPSDKICTATYMQISGIVDTSLGIFVKVNLWLAPL